MNCCYFAHHIVNLLHKVQFHFIRGRRMLHVYNSNPVVTNSTPSIILLLLANQSSAPIPIDGTHTVYKHTHL